MMDAAIKTLRALARAAKRGGDAEAEAFLKTTADGLRASLADSTHSLDEEAADFKLRAAMLSARADLYRLAADALSLAARGGS